MQIQDVFTRYGEDLRQAEEHMDRYLRSEVNLIPEVIRHLIGSGGKRFRPLLLLLSADLCGYRGDRRHPLSAVIEFIHTATLLHDDVIDNAKTRRGKTSANRIWGNAASVLVGDFLYSKSFKLMTDYGNLDIIKLISATTNVMSEGEVFQLVKCGDVSITEQEYLTIVEKKTAVLIAAACAVGGMLGDAEASHIDELSRYGKGVGMAFQITDDTLDYTAEEAAFGKAIGKDLEEGKLTLPLIFALANCTPDEKDAAQKAISRRALDEAAIRGIFTIIRNHDGIGYALQRARSYVDGAKKSLEAFPDCEARDALLAVAEFVIERKT
jgi:octaprenyl-diphosphate synthase